MRNQKLRNDFSGRNIGPQELIHLTLEKRSNKVDIYSH
jgi:hypothetical protein